VQIIVKDWDYLNQWTGSHCGMFMVVKTWRT